MLGDEDSALLVDPITCAAARLRISDTLETACATTVANHQNVRTISKTCNMNLVR